MEHRLRYPARSGREEHGGDVRSAGQTQQPSARHAGTPEHVAQSGRERLRLRPAMPAQETQRPPGEVRQQADLCREHHGRSHLIQGGGDLGRPEPAVKRGRYGADAPARPVEHQGRGAVGQLPCDYLTALDAGPGQALAQILDESVELGARQSRSAVDDSEVITRRRQCMKRADVPRTAGPPPRRGRASVGRWRAVAASSMSRASSECPVESLRPEPTAGASLT